MATLTIQSIPSGGIVTGGTISKLLTIGSTAYYQASPELMATVPLTYSGGTVMGVISRSSTVGYLALKITGLLPNTTYTLAAGTYSMPKGIITYYDSITFSSDYTFTTANTSTPKTGTDAQWAELAGKVKTPSISGSGAKGYLATRNDTEVSLFGGIAGDETTHGIWSSKYGWMIRAGDTNVYLKDDARVLDGWRMIKQSMATTPLSSATTIDVDLTSTEPYSIKILLSLGGGGSTTDSTTIVPYSRSGTVLGMTGVCKAVDSNGVTGTSFSDSIILPAMGGREWMITAESIRSSSLNYRSWITKAACGDTNNNTMAIVYTGGSRQTSATDIKTLRFNIPTGETYSLEIWGREW